jgi:murein DD-endopeptidase MepM/ murein hydrolase activator NlpD
MSRRRLLAVLAGATTAAALGAPALVRATAGLQTVNGSASALAPAERLPPLTTPDPTSPDTGSATTDDDEPDAVSDQDDPDVTPGIEPPPPGRLAFPVAAASDCYVLDNYGDCRSGCTRLHEGIDIMGSRGEPVYAIAPGVLTKQYVDTGKTWGAGNGWTLYDESEDVVYRYFHLDRHADGLEEGDEVVFGQLLGYVGRTGTSGVDNYHLHFEYRPRNVAVNPLPLMDVPTDMCGISPPIRG